MPQRHHILAAVGLVGFAVTTIPACLLATQITLELQTNARCPDDKSGSGARMVDVIIESARGDEITTSTTTTDCTEAEDANRLGTLVFVPGSDVEGAVTVVMGMHVVPPDDVPCVAFASMSDNACLSASSDGPSDETVNIYRNLAAECCDSDPGTRCDLSAFTCESDSATGCDTNIEDVGVLELLPCIVARRRVGFVAHTQLELPVSLDAACIGITCDENTTCFDGRCVTAEVRCDENDPRCEPMNPQGSGGAGGSGGMGGMGPDVSSSLSALSSSLTSSSISASVVSSSLSSTSVMSSSGALMNCTGMCGACPSTRECTFYVMDCLCACESSACSAACPSFPSASCSSPNPCTCQSGTACTASQMQECSAAGGTILSTTPCVCII